MSSSFSGYGEIHRKMERKFGYAKEMGCMVCGKYDEKIPRQIHWANLDHKYTNDLQTWTTMCHHCHMDHDAAILKDRQGERAYWGQVRERLSLEPQRFHVEDLINGPKDRRYGR